MERIKIFTLLGFVGVAILFFSFVGKNNPNSTGKIKSLVIDPGHGGHYPGALGTVAKEKEVTLGIGLQLRKLIREKSKDIKVTMTRETDEFVELYKRAEYAADADFFISIHCNSNKNKAASGSESFVLGLHRAEDNLEVVEAENKVIESEENHESNYAGLSPGSPSFNIFIQALADIHLEQSIMMATNVQNQLRENYNRKDRGVKQAGFVVLVKAAKPSILIETGFISNTEEEKFLHSETGQGYVAQAIYNAILEYNKQVE